MCACHPRNLEPRPEKVHFSICAPQQLQTVQGSAYICGTPSKLFPNRSWGFSIQAGLLDWASLPICTTPPCESNRGSCPAAHLEKVDGSTGLSLLGPLARHGPHISTAEIAEGPLQQFTATQSLAPSVAMDARPTFGDAPLIRCHHSAQKSLCVGLLRLHFWHGGCWGRRQSEEPPKLRRLFASAHLDQALDMKLQPAPEASAQRSSSQLGNSKR